TQYGCAALKMRIGGMRQRRLRESDHFRRLLNQHYAGRSAAGEHRQAGRACAGPEIYQSSGKIRGNGSSQHHGVHARPVAPSRWLHKIKAAAMERIDRMLGKESG